MGKIRNALQKHKVIGAGIGYTMGNYLLKGVSFFTIPIFAHMLSSYDYGMYNTYIAYESILYIVIGLALHTSFKKAKYKFRDTLHEYVSSCILLGFVSLCIWLAGLNIFYGLAASYLEMNRWTLNFLILHSFCSALIQYFNSYVGLNYQFVKFLKISFFNICANIIMSILLIFMVFQDQRYYGRILGTALPVMLIGIYIIYFFFRQKRPKYNKGYWKFALSYSLPIIPHGVSQVILSQFDRIMISRMVGASEAGIYSFGYNVYTIMQVTSNSLANIWEPWFFEKMEKKDYQSIREKGFLFAAGMLVFSSCLVFMAPEIILALGTGRYSEAVYCVAPIVIGGYLSFLYLLPCEVEYYYEKTKFIAAATCLAAMINIILNYLFIKKFGYIAAAYTTLATYFFYFLFHYFMAWKIEGHSIYSNRAVAILIALAFMAGAISIAFREFFSVRCILLILTLMISFGCLEKKYHISVYFKEGLSKWKN